MDSGTNEGKIALGGTPPTAYNSGNGFYVDGTGKFLIGSGSGDHLQFDGTNFDVQVGSLELDATNIEISSTNASMSLGEGKILLDGSNDLIRVGSNASNNVKVVGTATQGYIHTGKTSAASTTAGFWLANNAGDPEFHVGNSTDYLKFDGGDLNITSQNLEISSSTIQISTAQASMSLGHDNSNPYGKIIVEGSGTPTFRVGPSAQDISLTAGSGIYIDGDGNFKFGDSDGQVKFQDGSFSITGSDVAINVTDINISASGFELSSTQASMSLGTNKQWVAFGGNTSPYLSVGQSTVGYGNSGVFLGYVNSVTRPRVSFVGSTGHFKVDQDVDIKTETFELDANTGDLQISSAHKSMSLNDGTIILDGPNKKIKVGSTNAVTIQGGGNGGVDNYIVMGSKADFSDYDKSTQGIIMGMDTSVPKFEMAKSSTNYLRWDTTSGLDLATEAMEVSASNIQISSAQASMSVGPSQTNPIVLQSLGNDRFLKFGGKTDFDQTGTAGFIMGIDNGTAKFDFTVGSSNDNYFRIDGSGVDIKTDKFELDTTTLDISSTNRRITIFDTDGTTEWVRIGEISTDASDLYGIKVYDGTGTNDATDLIAMFGEQGNKIAGWEITGTQLRSIPDAGLGGQFAEGENGLILHSSGRLESADFATNLKGWRIDSLGNGTAEFENARIRGTLSTAVFEKESVNVVGGQLMVANSTTLQPLRSGSAIIAGNSGSSATDVTMSFANVSGFASGEILKAKKVGQTGFSVEYLQVTGSKRYSSDPALAHITGSQIDPDGLSGEIYVGRGYGQITNISSSVGTLDGAMSDTATYSTSQSIVLDLGSNVVNIQDVIKIDTEKFKIISGSITGNTGANQTIEVLRDFHNTDPDSHSNGATVYKINGDNEFLQGLVSTPVEYNEGQVFVSTGKYDASADLSSGYILMNANPNDISTPYMDIVERTGSGVYDLQLRTRLGDLSGLSSAYLYGDEEPGFGLYTENGFFRGTLHAMTGSIHGILHVATQQGGIETNQKISIGRNVDGTQDGIYINNNNYWFTDAEWRVGDATNYIHLSGSGGNLGNDLSIQVEKFELDADTGELQISSTEHSMSFNDDDILIHAKDSGGSHIKVGRNVDRAITISGSQYHGAIYSGKANVTDTTAGFWLANNNTDPEFHLGNSTNFMKYDGGALSMTTQTFELDAGTGDLQLSSGNTSMSFADNSIKIGATSAGSGVGYLQVGQDITKAIQITGSNTVGSIRSVKDSFTDNTAGFWIANSNGVQEFNVGTATQYIKFNSGTGNLQIASDDIQVTASNVDISTGIMKIDADDYQIDSTAPSMSLGYDTNANAGMTFIGGSPSLIGFGPKGAYNMELSSTTTDDYLKIGSRDFGSGTGIILGSDNGTYKLEMYRNESNYLTFSSAGDLSIRTDTFDLQGTNMALNNTRMYLGEIQSDSDAFGAGVYMDNGGAFRVFGNPTNFLTVDGGSMALATDDFSLDTAKGDIIFNSLVQRISMGASPPVDTFTANGIILSGSGYFNFQKDQYNYIRHDANGLGLASHDLQISGSDTFRLHGKSDASGGSQLRLGSSADDITATANTGIFMDSGAVFRVGEATSGDNFIYFNGSNSLQIKSTNFDLSAGSAGSGELGVNTTRIALGDTLPTAYNSGTGFFVNKDGEFLLGAHGGDRIQYGGSGTLTIVSSNMDITANTFNLNAGSGKLILENTTPKLQMTTTDAKILLGSATTVDLGEGIFMDGAGNFRMGDATSGGTDYLKFTSGGDLVIKSSDIDITATEFALDATELYISSANKRIALGADGSDVTYNSSGIFLGEDGSGVYKFSLKSASDSLTWDGAGTLTITGNVTADSGNIGGWDIVSNTLESVNSKVILDSTSDGKIRLGASPPSSATSGTGIFLGGDGTFLVGASSGNRIQFTSNGNIVLQSNTFSLLTNTIIIDSGVNSGNIRLGASGGPTSNAAGQGRAGVYMDGTGDFFISDGGTSGATGTESYLKFDASGTPGASSFELKTPALTFEADGTITSQDYLIERSRLFGAGSDGDVVLKSNDCTVANGGTKVSNDSIKDDRGDVVCSRSGATWTMQGDWYTNSLEVDSSVAATTLVTNGYRIFVKGTLTIDSTCIVHNDGSAGQAGSGQTGGGNGGAGGAGGTLSAGTDGVFGGDGGSIVGIPNSTSAAGRKGGGGGGSGGIIFISARTVTNNGVIRSVGGTGGVGQNSAQAA